LDNFDNKGRKVCCKVSLPVYIKAVAGKVVVPFEWYQYIGRG